MLLSRQETRFKGSWMMAIRRAMTLVVALVVSASFAVSAQQAPKQDNKKRSKQEQAEIEQLKSQMVQLTSNAAKQ